MINLVDIVSASNGLYDNIVTASNTQPVFSLIMLVSIFFAVCATWVGSSVCFSKSVMYACVFITFVLSSLVAIFSFAIVVCQSVVLMSRPSVVDVVEVCYGVEALSTDDTSDAVAHCFVDYELVSDTSSTATFDSDGKVLNAVVVVDDSLNVYVINTDTNKIVEPAVSDSEEVAKLLEGKFQK